MKFFVRRVTYGCSPGYTKGRTFLSLLKKYDLALVEAGTRFSKKEYLIRNSDLIWLLNEDCIDQKEKLQTSMYTCGTHEHIENWLMDKCFHNSLSDPTTSLNQN